MTVEKQVVETKDLYQQVTDQIIEALSQSTDWVMPWHQKGLRLPQNIVTQKSYSGVNILSLWLASYKNQYSSPLWGTYKQWQEKGAQVRKGEKAHQIVFYKDFEKEEENEKTGELELVKRFVLKASSVFNIAQVVGFESPAMEPIVAENPFAPCQEVEIFISKTEARIVNCFTSAFYHPSEDIIGMPAQDCFLSTDTSTAQESYYSTLFHELTRWTGHQNRLDRIVPTARFGSEASAVEELVGELGSAFLCAELGISPSPREDHAAYIANWLKVLKDDKKAIFYAARQATLAAQFLKTLTNLQPL